MLSFLHRGERRPRVGHFHAQGHPVDWGQLCQTWAATPDIGKVQKCGPCRIFGTGWGRTIENILGQKCKSLLTETQAPFQSSPRTSQPRAPPPGTRPQPPVSQQKDAVGTPPTRDAEQASPISSLGEGGTSSSHFVDFRHKEPPIIHYPSLSRSHPGARCCAQSCGGG